MQTMQNHRLRLLLRRPKRPTSAGWFWLAYFLALWLLGNSLVTG